MVERPDDPNDERKLQRLEAELERLRAAEERLRDQNDELVESQQLLEEAKDDYAEIQDLAPVPLLSLTPGGLIRSANLAAAELLREERSRLVGSPLLDFCVRDQRSWLETALFGGEPAEARTLHVELALRDGARLPVDLRLRASPRKPGVLHVTLSDSTERDREAQERDELLRASQTKDHLIATLSHELRTPLTPALAIASKMTQQPSLAGGVRESFEVIHRNLEAEARLIDDLLDATGIARGKLRIERQTVDLHEIVKQSVEACLPRAQAKHITLHTELAASQVHAYADPLRLRQVFSNLLANAIKYTPEGGEVAARSWDGPSSIVIEVSDNGVGFAPEDAPRLFAAFEQLECGNQPRAGLGLGLAIAKGLVDLHGGSLTATSPGVGQGSRFSVELQVEPPLSRAEVEPPPRRSTPPLTSTSDAVRKHRVLLIEDHPDTAQVMSELFHEVGYEVENARSCAEALRVDLTHIDVIVSDLGLPDGSGLELLPRLRQCRYVPAVALSGYGMDADVRAARSAGFEQHLTKPVDFGRLLEVLSQLLGHDASSQIAG